MPSSKQSHGLNLWGTITSPPSLHIKEFEAWSKITEQHKNREGRQSITSGKTACFGVRGALRERDGGGADFLWSSGESRNRCGKRWGGPDPVGFSLLPHHHCQSKTSLDFNKNRPEEPLRYLTNKIMAVSSQSQWIWEGVQPRDH